MAECIDLRLALGLTRGKPDLRRLAVDASLDVVKRSDAIESLSRNLGLV